MMTQVFYDEMQALYYSMATIANNARCTITKVQNTSGGRLYCFEVSYLDHVTPSLICVNSSKLKLGTSDRSATLEIKSPRQSRYQISIVLPGSLEILLFMVIIRAICFCFKKKLFYAERFYISHREAIIVHYIY